MPFRPGYKSPPMDKRAQFAAGRTRTLALPTLPADTPADEHVSVAQAAELLVTSQQSINKSIVSGVLPAYQLDGRRRVLVADLATTPTGREQADEVAAERHRLAWLGEHTRSGRCRGRLCSHWTHSADDVPEPRQSKCSPKLAAHLASVRAKALVNSRAAGAERARLRALDIAEQRAHLQAEDQST